MRPAPVLLVDSGPLVALLDGGDPAHALVTEAWLPLRGRILTTAAVLTEAFRTYRHGRNKPPRLVIQDGLLR